ncbi:MAG: hypothetical protein ACW98F_11890, partial [Candidatus Hodarchaeales archaeon]
RHVSFQQIYCLLVHFVISYNLNNLDKQIMTLLLLLIHKRIESFNLEGHSERNHFSVVNFVQRRLNHSTNIV